MEQNLHKDFKRAVENVSLNVQEKALMRERLISYMEHVPIRAARSNTHKFHIPTFSFFRAHHLQGALVVALLATVSTFGVSSAAEDALPGDFLYSVKINVNEEVKTAFLNSDADVLHWESERAELRLKEASQLAVEGRLDSGKQETVSKLLAQHTDAINEKVRAIENSDPALAVEVSTTLEASLGAHEAVLARLIVEQEQSSTSTIEVGHQLVDQVRTSTQETEQSRKDAEQLMDVTEEILSTATSSPNTPDETVSNETAEQRIEKGISINLRVRVAHRMQERATQSSARAREQITTLDPNSELAIQAATQISLGESLMVQGTTMLAEHEVGQAYEHYRRANMLFQKVARLLEAFNTYPTQSLRTTVTDELPSTASTSTSTPPLDTDRENAEKALTETRSLLLAIDGFDERVITQSNSYMKDAMAQIMRGDAALSTGNAEDAVTLFGSARIKAERAHTLITRTVHDMGDINIIVPSSTAVEDTLPSFMLVHRYEGGVHTWSGAVDIPTSCAPLEAGTRVVESSPEQITLTLNTTESVDTTCTQSTNIRTFEIRAAASADAQVKGVEVDGVNRAWSIVEGSK